MDDISAVAVSLAWGLVIADRQASVVVAIYILTIWHQQQQRMYHKLDLSAEELTSFDKKNQQRG